MSIWRHKFGCYLSEHNSTDRPDKGSRFACKPSRIGCFGAGMSCLKGSSLRCMSSIRFGLADMFDRM